MVIDIIIPVLVLTVYTAIANRLIGNGDWRNVQNILLKSRWSYFGVFFILLSVIGYWMDSWNGVLSAGILGLSFVWWRQIIGPDLAFFAGHGGVVPHWPDLTSGSNKYVNSVVEQLFGCFIRMGASISSLREYGVHAGMIIGLVKGLPFYTLGVWLVSPVLLAFIPFGLLYGVIHQFTHDYLKPHTHMRENAEYIIGAGIGLISGIGVVL